jgi:DNA invertase Pin-like site-specific DNA recombinase
MEKVVSFIRINKNDEEYTEAQAIGIAKYIKEKKLNLEKNIEVEVNRPEEEENIFKILESCKNGCTVVVYNINVFGRTTTTILENIKYLLSHGVRIISVSQNLDFISDNDMLTKVVLGVISMTINLEKDLMSLRTKEALTAKKLDGVSLGKPKGTIQKSKFDEQRDKIEELLSVGLSVRKIAKVLGYNNHIGLNNYVKKRNIREEVFGNGILAS